MHYTRCPTCGTKLGNRQIDLDNALKIIEANTTMTDQEKQDARSNAVNNLNLKYYCCKMRVITAINKSQIIK